MGSNLKDHQLNRECYMQKRLYKNLMATIYQKPLINMQRIKTKNQNISLKKIRKTWKTENNKGYKRKSSETIMKQIIKWQ